VKRIRVSPWTASLFGLLLVSACWIRSAAAEVLLVERNGWEIFTDGRVGAFASVAVGKDIPVIPAPPAPNPAPPSVQVGIFASDAEQDDASQNILASRLRSGLMPNIFAIGLRRQLSETTRLRGYVALWASADTNRVKYTKSAFDVRQGYMQIEGRWGSFLAGRAMALFSRGNFEIDYLYQHGYGLGHPCKIDSSGEESGFTGGGTCGHMGFGVLHPGYDSGLAYATPSLGGLQLTVGIYDPVGSGNLLPRTPYPRPEGELAFVRKLGALGMIKLFASGMWQRSQTVIPDPANPMANTLVSKDAYGLAGGGRLEVGALRLGIGVFTGKGLGTHIALNATNDLTTLNRTTFNYRQSRGIYGAIAGVFGRYMVNAGFGTVRVYQLTEDVAPAGQTPLAPLPKQQYGISVGFNVRLSEVLVFDIDYFRAHSQWYDFTDPATNAVNTPTQVMNFVSSGLTVLW
jgi:hypothetical protein